jgi:hypothetical protein
MLDLFCRRFGRFGLALTGPLQCPEQSIATGDRDIRKERTLFRKNLLTCLAVGASAAALAAPALAEAPAQDLRSPDTRDLASPSVPDLRSPDTRDVAAGRPLSAPGVHLVRVSQPPGFDWGDAGIGAGGGAALVLIALGSGMVVAQRRRLTH